jgi:hypothetical protein
MMLKEAKTHRYPILSGCIIACIIFLSLASLSFGATVNLGPIGDVTTWPSTPYRWMDIADNLYSTNYQDTFTYAQPSVTLTYDDVSNTFSGTLTATGLKPNFAYQMKLVGKPTSGWAEGGDDWTNEQIGYAGRWWRKQPNPGNTNDTDYNTNKDDTDYIFEGYLLFDFFVTDDQGDATVDFAADSSFHVLWATPGSTSEPTYTGHRNPGPNDSAVRDYYFTASTSTNSNAYDSDHGSAHVGIYAEWQDGRALPGELLLPNGEYNCQFILTEESFHQSVLGGYWAGAMGYEDVQFTVVPIPSTVLLFVSGLIGIAGLRRRKRKLNNLLKQLKGGDM